IVWSRPAGSVGEKLHRSRDFRLKRRALAGRLRYHPLAAVARPRVRLMSVPFRPGGGAPPRPGEGLSPGSTARGPRCAAEFSVPDEPGAPPDPATGFTDSTRPAPGPSSAGGQFFTDRDEAGEPVPRWQDRPEEDEYDDDRDWRRKYRRDE